MPCLYWLVGNVYLFLCGTGACTALNKTVCSCLGVCIRETGGWGYGQCATGMCMCVSEGDSVCVSYIAPGSCYGHILITRSMLDYVLWACNITPSGQSPNRFPVSQPLAGKKHISRDSPKHCFQFCSTCENVSSHMIPVQRYVFAVLSASARSSLSQLQWTELQV